MTPRRLAVLLLGLILAPSAAALPGAAAGAGTLDQARPVPPDPDMLAIIHEDPQGRRSPLLDPRGLPIYDDLDHGLQPTITIDRINALGYDIVLDFRNNRTQPVGLGSIDIGVITLGPDISWLNLNRRSEFVEEQRRRFSGQNRAYPGSFYAPVGVLHNDEFAVGVSLLYDVLQDRHGINVKITTPGGSYLAGPGGPGYSIGFDLGNPVRGAGKVRHPGQLAPGEQRQYRVAVRAVKLDRPVTPGGSQQWLAAIEPYREHFENLYGGVTYQRNDRPVRGRSIASPNSISPANPMGFNGGRTRRPDLVGWGPMVAELMRPSGFDRTMLWSAGGLYTNNTQLNFPSRFMSQLLTSSEMNTAFDDRIGLPRLANSGHQMGLWWGRSSRVARRWDTSQWEPLDLNAPDRVALALHEMQLAHEAGATLIGLDAFLPSDMPVWQQYEWIIELRRRYPDTTFVVEPMSCDILHTLAPTFIVAWRAGDRTGRPESRYRVHHANHTADFLIPGHETWGFFRDTGSNQARNTTRVQRDAEYIARTGHVPVISTPLALTNPSQARAEPTWLRTVPDHLKTDAHRTATPSIFRIPGVNDTPTDDDEPADRGGGGNDTGRGKGGGEGGGNGDGKGDDPRTVQTRPFMLPNGRVIRLPVYDR